MYKEHPRHKPFNFFKIKNVSKWFCRWKRCVIECGVRQRVQGREQLTLFQGRAVRATVSSCKTISSPSAVLCISNSAPIIMPPILKHVRTDDRVFSGMKALAPRWPANSIFGLGSEQHRFSKKILPLSPGSAK